MKVDSRSPDCFQSLLAEQVSANSRLFFRLAYGVLRDSSVAEEVCQHAFMKAWECRGQISDGSALRAWLSRVVVNESLGLLRRRKTEHRALADARLAVSSTTSSSTDTIDLRERVINAIAALPEPTRLIVSLRIQSGFSGNEVKEIVGCSAAEVSRQLHFGMDILRKDLASFRELELGASHGM